MKSATTITFTIQKEGPAASSPTPTPTSEGWRTTWIVVQVALLIEHVVRLALPYLLS